MLLKTKTEATQLEDQITESLFLDLYDLLSSINRQIGLNWLRGIDKSLYSPKIAASLDRLETDLQTRLTR